MIPRPADVSVVVQGPQGGLLTDVLASVRQHLPGSELILSTWRGAPNAGYDADVLVENDDPGSAPYRTIGGAPSPRLSNTNRMLRSTRLGVAQASRPFILKLRTDTPLVGTDVLSWWNRFPARGSDLRVFEERVICPSVAVRPGARSPQYLFHPSDCVHFGLAADVQRLWAADEIDELDNTTYWLHPGRDATTVPFSPVAPRYFNEQVLWLAALEAAGHHVDYPHAGYRAHDAVATSDASIVTNFVVLEPWQMGITMPKLHPMVRTSDLGTYLHFPDWLEAYRDAAASALA